MNAVKVSGTLVHRLQLLAVFWCGCIILGLFTGNIVRVLSSLGIMGLVATSIFYAYMQRGVSRSRFTPAYWSLMGVFGIHAVWGVLTQAGNWDEFARSILLQSPFLLLPLAFWLLAGLPGRYLRGLYLFFIGLVTVSALGSTGYYLLHTAQIHKMYLQSQIMPTVPDHIRFSLMVTYAIAIGVMLLWKRAVQQKWRKPLRAVVVLLIIYQHMLAVRSGLLTLYVLAALSIVALVLWEQKYKLAVLGFALMWLLPMLSYAVLPTFHNKFLNTQEDVGRVEQSGSANNYSLVGRIYSYKVALEIVEEHPWVGVGRANMEQAIAREYKASFPQITPKAYILPHNQFLFNLVAFGGIGILLFTVLFYFPGIRVWPRQAPLLLSHYLIVTLSFLVEYPLELQVGLNFTLIFLLLALNGQEKPSESDLTWRPV
jgi:O-antigen ligase